MARRLGGRFLVRIEDIDVARCREEYVAGIFEDLAWLGLDWEEPVLRQSEHFADYADAAQRLEAQGVLYPCFASRSRDRGGGGAGRARSRRRAALSRTAQGSGAGRDRRGACTTASASRCASTCSGRVTSPASGSAASRSTFTELDDDGSPQVLNARPEQWGDAVILRKDVPASYHLAVVVDDARQGITHVTRGRDLFPATGLHRLLQVLLDLPRAALPAPSAADRRRRTQAVEERRRVGPGGAARRRCHPLRRAPHARPLIAGAPSISSPPAGEVKCGASASEDAAESA